MGEEMRGGGFKAALKLASEEFVRKVFWCANCWLPAREIVKEALEHAAAVHHSRGIAVLPRNCPWDQHLFELEEELAASGDASAIGATKYILYEDTKKQWRVQAVPVQAGSFESRKKLPEKWRGLKGSELDSET